METIKNLTLAELQDLMKTLGQPAFRAKQLYQWLYTHHAPGYEAMTNLPAALRAQLAEEHPYEAARLTETQASADGTRKYLVAYPDGIEVEAVGIPSEDGRLTVCVSTQAGCPMACAFCATGLNGLARSLEAGEIVEQVLLAQEDFGHRVSNVVFMGQGEPFLNLDAVTKALHILNDPAAVGIGARSMTVSTCGLIAGIDKFAEIPEQFTLAISLHAADQEVRDRLMPKVRNQPLEELRAAIVRYTAETNRRVTLEYLLIDGVNDRPSDLRALQAFAKGLLCHVNLIPLNAVPGSPWQPSPKCVIEQWDRELRARGIEATVRRSRGSDIDGACGQLRNARLK